MCVCSLILTDEAISLFESGMQAVYEEDHPGETAKMDLWEMKRRFNRPEIPMSAYESVIQRMTELNDRSAHAVTDLSAGLGVRALSVFLC